MFFGDICGFTKLTAMSTASQTIKFLNDLYNIFDNAIDVFDVYKVDNDDNDHIFMKFSRLKSLEMVIL